MNSAHTSKGPWAHRALVYLFSLLFGLLVYWLLGFLVGDIATWPGPNYRQIEQSMLDPQVTQELAALKSQIEETNRAIADHRQRQSVLRDSASNSEQTMNRLLELQRLTLQKGLKPSGDELAALAESEKLFLDNQRKYQEINERIASLSEQVRELESRQRAAQKRAEAQREPISREFDRQHARHQLKVAALKLSLLTPLLVLAVWLFLKRRGGLYAPLIYGLGLAVLVKTLMVMHEHFPRRYFKYVLIVMALLLVARILVYLLRLAAFPRADWLLRQYREAYERFACPICAYPIRRGPLKYLYWNRRSLKKLNVPLAAEGATDEPYTCPACGTRLFEECPACKRMRHSLLPICSQCGAEKPLPATGAAAAPGGAPARQGGSGGFTLIEVLVVVAVIAVLAGLLLPVLSRGKGRAQGIACASNLRQLAVALELYSHDHEERFVNNHGINETLRRRENWVNNVQDWLESEGNTNRATLASGKLAPFLAGNTDVYKCPADKSAADNGPRIRSYALNSMVGDPGELTNRFNPHLVQFFGWGDLPSPAAIYFFLEEHPDTLNDGFFMNRWAEYRWGNLPASYHNGAANLTFGDGHVESHRWALADTRRPPVKGGAAGTFEPAGPEDYNWLKERTSIPNDSAPASVVR